LICQGNPICAGVVTGIIVGVTSGDLGLALRSGLIAAVTAGAFKVVGDLTGQLGLEGVLDAELGGHGPLGFMSEAHVFNMAGHALVGCGSAVLKGSKCGPGALAGAMGSFAGPLMKDWGFTSKLIATSVLGGLASVAGGGKFGNGALTAAFGYLFNEVGIVCRSAGTATAPASHCGLFVFDRNSANPDDLRGANIRAQFSLGWDELRFNTVFSTWADDLQAFWSGSGYQRVDPPSGVSQEDFEAAVIRNSQEYRASSYSAPFGPNSNSAVGYGIVFSGGTIPNVPTAVQLHYWRHNFTIP